ncbi:MAG: alpha-glucuronidase family glycosyl hydrolase [candidate division KSB1 bacterium]|nr:alpha-glucuronidase family glycosyl hydrolase [candidate division KSB1 bacterium]
MKKAFNRYVFLLAGILCIVLNSYAKDGYNLWLQYERVKNPQLLQQYKQNVTEIVVPGNGKTFQIIKNELSRGLANLLQKDMQQSSHITRDGAVAVGSVKSSAWIASLGWEKELGKLGDEGYIIRSAVVQGKKITVIASDDKIGALYGSFHFLRLLQTRKPINALNIIQSPKIQRRFLNHWDNIYSTRFGTIERGYAGKTLWKWEDLPDEIDHRYRDYARANASIGINSVVLNNVNAEPHILKNEYLKKAAALSDIFRPYGITVYLTANYNAPMKPSETPFAFKKWGGIGNLHTADPLDPDVIQWWTNKVDTIYKYIPDFGGFLVKANSEGMPGPQDYGRTHAEGANMLAKALKPHNGIVMWRAFVYNSDIDSDRAKRAYKEFVPLDGQFESNVFIQPKNGPLDFQPREPVHPLFGAMPQTPLLMEFQITQEYLGESTYLVYLDSDVERNSEF